MKRLLWLFGVLTVALTLGCGDSGPSDPGDGGGGGGDDPFTGLKSGTWETSFVATLTGGDAVCNLAPTITQTARDTLCAGDTVDPSDDLDCDIDVDGENYSFSCETVEQNDDGCFLKTAINGSGKLTDTTYSFTGTMSFGPTTPGSAECQDAFGCTYNLTITGTWLSSDGTDTCGEASPALSDVLRKSIAGAFE